MFIPSRRAAVILTGVAMSIYAPAALAGHPHGPDAPHDMPAKDNAPTEIIEIIKIEPEDVTDETGLQILSEGDFDINDFLGADGMVDVEKLRAYEDGKQDYIAKNTDALAKEPARSRAETDEEADEIIIYERPVHMPPKNTPAKTGTAADMIERMVTDTPADVDKDEHNQNRSGVESSHSNAKIRRKEMRKQKRKNRGRTITLSGETTVNIAPDGTVTIMNNGDAIVPLKFSDNQTGNASAMVMDGGKPAKVTVQKKMTNKNGKRKVRVEIEMESEIID